MTRFAQHLPAASVRVSACSATPVAAFIPTKCTLITAFCRKVRSVTKWKGEWQEGGGDLGFHHCTCLKELNVSNTALTGLLLSITYLLNYFST